MANSTTIQDKLKFEASSHLVKLRNTSRNYEKKESEITNVWEKKPIDFSPRLYQPKPPKRNSKEAMKPWKYKTLMREKEASINVPSKKCELGLNEYLVKKVSNMQPSFKTSFRLLTPNQARIEASKTMGFRDGLELYRNPKSHDFRGVIIYTFKSILAITFS